MWRQRLLSPILSPGKFAEYLVDEFNKINAVCSDSPSTEPTAAEVGESPSPVAKRADGVYDGASTPALPTHPGAIENCGQYYDVVEGDTCGRIAAKFWIGLAPTCGQIMRSAYLRLKKSQFPQMEIVEKDMGPYCKSNNRCGPCDLDDLDPEDVTPTDTMPNNPAPSTPVDSSPTKPVPELPAPSSTAPTFPSDSAQDDFATPEPTPTADDPTPGNTTPTKPVPPKETGRPDNATMAISVDGKCSLNVSCTGSSFGDCCSTSGYCGTGSDWCGVGNCLAGACEKDDGNISFDGTCGPLFPGNKTCSGSKFGDCCSVSGYCGTGPDWCGK
ncbi:DNA polymerase III subunits gamma and tau domain-containing protein [Histoplasma capsulatum]|uniref:DNA polymerase III subunits gamma and tau domain-containing protein n=2 Tax=Histoplasma TaxID=5036 RepID=A0A8A1ME72_AJECA|nr:DNA polymerase III subunits gamma and tau domain-containing protein [Histoplasma capsulatum]